MNVFSHQIREIAEAANKQGFSFETERFDWFGKVISLDDGVGAFVCHTCGAYQDVQLDRSDIMDWIQNLSCTDSEEDECCSPDPIRELTQQNQIAWIHDALIFRSYFELIQSQVEQLISAAQGRYFTIGSIESIYVSVLPADKLIDNLKNIAIFLKTDGRIGDEYLLFAATTHDLSNLSFQPRWRQYYEELLDAIVKNTNHFQQKNHDMIVAERTATGYISWFKAYCNIAGVTDEFDTVLNRISVYAETPTYLKFFLKTHRCPVCGTYYLAEECICAYCGFPELNKIFLNREDGENWNNEVVEPYTSQYMKNQLRQAQELLEHIHGHCEDILSELSGDDLSEEDEDLFSVDDGWS